MTRILWNGGVDIFNAGVIPLWNTATYYLIEPTVVLARGLLARSSCGSTGRAS